MKTFFLLLILIFISHFLQSPNYPHVFKDDYQDALNYFTKNKPKLVKVFNDYNADLEIVIPVVFPERIRYSIVKDYFETAFLEVFYVDNGSKQVDFSIGDFQIKPSFAEKIEFYIRHNQRLKIKYKILLRYKNSEIKLIRKERIKRLKNNYFQIVYIAAFYDIIKNNFYLKDKNKTDLIKFFATAYNYGFDKTQKQVEKHINDKFFPYGSTYKNQQYSYSDISLYFYFNHYYSIFNKNK